MRTRTTIPCIQGHGRVKGNVGVAVERDVANRSSHRSDYGERCGRDRVKKKRIEVFASWLPTRVATILFHRGGGDRVPYRRDVQLDEADAGEI